MRLKPSKATAKQFPGISKAKLEALAAKAYEEVPADIRICGSYAEMDETAKEIWRDVAWRRWRAGG